MKVRGFWRKREHRGDLERGQGKRREKAQKQWKPGPSKKQVLLSG